MASEVGEVKANWRTLTMSFMSQGGPVSIQGDHSLERKLVSQQALKKEREIVLVFVLWKLGKTEDEKDVKTVGLSR